MTKRHSNDRAIWRASLILIAWGPLTLLIIGSLIAYFAFHERLF